MNRRHFIKAGAVSAIGVAGHAIGSNNNLPTPTEAEGPFYPVVAQKDQDFDLTMIKGHDKPALGEAIFITGEVIDTEGNPVEDATVDLWQANAAGRYSHPHDPNPAPLDKNFQGWAIVQTNKDGEFKFKTVLPGAYPASRDWTRPPHIHFKITKRGFIELTTQMYFPTQPLNDVDRLLQRKSKDKQELMIAQIKSNMPNNHFFYRIVIEEA